MKLIVAIAFLVAHAAAQPQQKCSADMVFNECGSACPPTCDEPEPQVCTMQCIIGCQCKPGLFKTKEGKCVERKDCPGGAATPVTAPPLPPACAADEVFNQCGTACPPTCETPVPEMCTEQCVIGCQCKSGLLRNKDGKCVERKNCPSGGATTTAAPQKCTKAHEKYNECGSKCAERTCSNKDGPVRPCPFVCQSGCYCEKPYIRDAQGNCVEESKCGATKPSQNKTCGRNERWSDDSCVHPSPMCQGPKCPNNSIMVKCAQICQQGGCVCKNGYYRDDKSNCVRLNRCNAEKSSTPRPRVRSAESQSA